jgi:hypothetical protein
MRVFLEIEEGKYKLRVSPYRAETPSPMHQRGKPFPDSFKSEYESMELAAIGLQELTEYFQCYEEKRHLKPRRGSKKEAAS